MNHAALSVLVGLAVACLTACTGASQTSERTPIDAPSTFDGLQRVQNGRLQTVYRSPNAKLSAYTKLLVRPVEVQFSKGSDAQHQSALYNMQEGDREKIRQELASAFRDVFRRKLQTEGGYVLVDDSGWDVLEVRAAIINLNITSPTTPTAESAKTYTIGAEEMTLIAELHDSVTGEVLTRAYDRRKTKGSWQWSDSISDTDSARQVMGTWADALRNALDASRSRAPAGAVAGETD